MSDAPQFQEKTKRFGLMQLDVEVAQGSLAMRLRPFERTSTRFALGDVDEAEVATYSPTDYGGWHWGRLTTPGGNTVYRLQGNQGVEVTMVGGRKIFIESERASELRDAILRGR